MKLLVFRPPKDISLRPVTDYHDLEKVNSVWPLKDANSFPFLQRLAKYNSNVGAYKEDGTLVAWIFRYIDASSIHKVSTHEMIETRFCFQLPDWSDCNITNRR